MRPPSPTTPPPPPPALPQEQLLRKVGELEGEGRALQRTIEERDAALARLQQEKEAQKKASDAEVREGGVGGAGQRGGLGPRAGRAGAGAEGLQLPGVPSRGLEAAFAL